MDAGISHVLRGTFNQKLPTPRSKSVKVFLLSNSTDFEEERRCIWFEILPDLQQYCLQHSAEIVLLDPYQGCSFDIITDCLDLQLLNDEIVEARETSAGIFFLCLLGDRYGPCPLPLSIKQDEFSHIRTSAFEAGKEVKLLDDWYKLDQNATPPAFQLNTEHNSKGKPLLNKTAYEDLVNIIQHGAKVAHQEGLINQVSQRRQERFFSSSIEQCVRTAMSTKDAIDKCLFVLRRISNFGGNGSDSAFSDGSVDEGGTAGNEGPQKLSTLKNHLSSTLDKPNLETFIIQSSSTVDTTQTLWAQSQERHKYLEKFVPHVTYKCKQLLDRGLLTQAHQYFPEDWKNRVLDEAVIHADFCIRMKSPNLLGRQDLLDKMRDWCRSAVKKKTAPMYITGGDGSGKTAMLCEIAHNVQSWLGCEPVLITRFAALTPASTMTHEFLISICSQAAMCYNLTDNRVPTYERTATMEKLVEWLGICFDAAKANAPLVLLIDDIHMLKSGQYMGASKATWLPATLPQNVIVIYTVSSQVEPDQLTITQTDTKCTCTLTPLPESCLMDITKNYLSIHCRTVSVDQTILIKQCLAQTPSPLFATLLAAQALKWRSYVFPKAMNLSAMHITAFLETILQSLENKHGKLLVSNACAYIECSQMGLSECELLDLLSCNRELMSSLKATNPLSNGRSLLMRFPAKHWIRLKQDIECLLITVVLDGYRLMRWRSSVVANVMTHRYLQTSVQRKRIHNDLAELFYNTWAEIEAASCIVYFGAEFFVVSTLANFLAHADTRMDLRLLMPRPLQSTSGELNVVSIRRVRELWFQLILSGNIDHLQDRALCNFHYLEALLQSTGLSHLLSVMEQAMFQVLHHDLQVLYNRVLRPSLESISCDPLLFASEIIGRLRFTRARNSRFLNQIVEQAMEWVDSHTISPLVVPLTCWLQPPPCPMALSFQMNDFGHGLAILQPTLNYQHLLVSGANDGGPIRMYHIASRTLVKSFLGHSERVTCIALSHDGQFFVTGSMDKTMRSWDLLQGNCIRNLAPHTDRIACVKLTNSDTQLVSGSYDNTAKHICLETGRVLRTFNQHSGPVVDLVLTENNEILITGSADFYVRVWLLEKGQLLSQIGGLMGPVTRLALTSNDTFLMVACEDETLRVFSLLSASELHYLRGHDGKVCSMTLATDDCQLFVGTSDGNIYCYDLHTGQLLETKSCHNMPVTSVQVSTDGYFLMSVSGDHIQVWNIEPRKQCKRSAVNKQDDAASGETDPITAVVMSKDARHALAGTHKGTIELWDLETCQIMWRTACNPPQHISVVYFMHDSRAVLCGTDQGVVCVWDMAAGTLLRQFSGHRSAIISLQMLRDNSRVLSHDNLDTVMIWPWQMDAQSGFASEDIITLKGVRDKCLLAATDRDLIGRATDSEKEVRIWSVNEDAVIQLRAKLNHVDAISCMFMSKDCKLLLTGSRDQSIKVWEIATGFLTQILVGHDNTVSCCAVSSDNTTVISGGEDNAVVYWEIETGTALFTMKSHTKPVTSVALTADSSVAMSSSTDGWIFAWSLYSGACLASFNAHVAILDLQCSPDCGRIILRAENCQLLPILCLHNSPASSQSLVGRELRKHRRTGSTSSLGSSISFGSNVVGNLSTVSMHDSGTVAATAGQSSSSGRSPRPPAPLNRQSSKVFAHLERTRSRTSLFENPTMSTKPEKTGASLKMGKSRDAETTSGVCTML